jgi:hypothetical protein
MKLGTLLLRNAAIGLTQLEGALRNQVLYGGRLGTNLVELGFLDLELLSAYLAELSGFPIATPTLLDDSEPELVARLGPDDAHRLRAIPLGYLGEGRAGAAVAFVDPADFSARDHVGAILGLPITPYVVPELRALYYLEKLYGLPRRPRFVRTGRPDTESDAVPDRRRSQPAAGMVLPPALTVEPRRHRGPAPAPLAAPPPVPVELSLESALARIDAATHREQIADALAELGRGRCDALVVFLVRDGHALGWRGYAAPGSTTGAPPRLAVEELSLPLGGASALQSAHDAAEPFAGPPPATARPIESRLWAALGTPVPAYVVVMPILVKQRAVNLIYAHSLSAPLSATFVGELGAAAGRAQAAYLRLIRQARGA